MVRKPIKKWEAELGKLRTNKKWEELLTRSYKCIDEWPEKSCDYFYCGNAKGEQGLYEEAIKDFDRAIESDPTNTKTYKDRAITTHLFGQNEEAITDLDKAIELDPKNATAYNNRGFIKSGLGLHDEAIIDFNKAIELDPEDKSLLENRAVTFGIREASKTSRKIEETYRTQLESFTNPSKIRKCF